MNQCIKRHRVVVNMFFGVGLPRSFWGKPSGKVTYLIDKCSFTLIDFEMPMKAWNRKLLDYSNLKVFRTFLFAHININQVVTKDVNYVFIGYPKGDKGHKLWDVKLGGSKFIINKYITFSETCKERKSM